MKRCLEFGAIVDHDQAALRVTQEDEVIGKLIGVARRPCQPRQDGRLNLPAGIQQPLDRPDTL
jgi:hypothetical protein